MGKQRRPISTYVEGILDLKTRDVHTATKNVMLIFKSVLITTRKRRRTEKLNKGVFFMVVKDKKRQKKKVLLFSSLRKSTPSRFSQKIRE